MDPSERQYVAILMRQITRLGIRIESRPWKEAKWRQLLDDGQFQMTRSGWLADYPNPENFVFLLYGPNKQTRAKRVELPQPRV